MSVSNSGRGIRLMTDFSVVFSLLFRANTEVVPRVEHDCVIANNFQICIYQPFYSSALRSKSRDISWRRYVNPCSIVNRHKYFDIISCCCLQNARMIMLFCVELIIYKGRLIACRNILCQNSSSYPSIF